MRLLSLLALCTSAFAEIHTLTLQQALDRALAQNPDVVLARLDEQHAKLQVGITNDPFTFQCGAGSGLAYTYGPPISINGNPPAIVQSQCKRTVFDRSQSYRVAQTREAAKGSAIPVRQRQADVAYRVTALFLDAEHAARSLTAARSEVESLERVKPLVEGRVREGIERPIELKQANSNVTNARLTVKQFENAQTTAQRSLSRILGYPEGDLVRPALEERPLAPLTTTEQQAITEAITASLEIRRLESDLIAKQLEGKSYRAERLPKINFFAQYSLLSKINNFEDFYLRYQANNFQIGASIEIPIFTGSAPKAAAAQADVAVKKIRAEIQRERSRIAGDIQQSYSDLELANATRDARRESLELAMELVRQQLALQVEGRSTVAQVEASRVEEQRAWVVYYEAQRSLEVAQLNIRKATGTILASAR